MASKPKEDRPPPKCKAILLCQQITVDAGTARASVLDILQSLDFATLPGQTKPMELYLQLVDGMGRYDITVEIHDLAEERTIGRGKGLNIFMPDPLRTLQLAIPIPSLPITHAGYYDVIVFANRQEIDRQQFVAIVHNIGEGNET